MHTPIKVGISAHMTNANCQTLQQKGQRETETKTLPWTFKWDKSLLLMDFVFHSKASGCFLPMNYTVTIGWLYCLDLAWFFSRLVIHSSSFVFTFFTTASSLLNFLFVECSWDVVSFSFNIWLQRLDISESTITFPFKAIIFCISSGFYMAFIADSDKVNKLVLSRILICLI